MITSFFCSFESLADFANQARMIFGMIFIFSSLTMLALRKQSALHCPQKCTKLLKTKKSGAGLVQRSDVLFHRKVQWSIRSLRVSLYQCSPCKTISLNRLARIAIQVLTNCQLPTSNECKESRHQPLQSSINRFTHFNRVTWACHFVSDKF